MSTAFRSAPRSRRPPAAPRSPLHSVPAKPRSVRSVPSGRANAPLRAVPSPTVSSVKRLPPSRKIPLWVRLLVQLQRGSLVVAFILVVAALVVYGSTVYTQQLWSKEYRKLKTLTRNEREMVATTESLKNQLALSAERPESGLVTPTPNSTIFLQPAPQRQAAIANSSVQTVEAAPKTPLGY